MQRQITKNSSQSQAPLRFYDRRASELIKGSSILFVLDIDENLAKIQIKEDSSSHITASAQPYVSNSAPGTIHLPELEEGKVGVLAQAFRRPAWKGFFEQVAAINEQYSHVRFGAKGKLVNFIFLTNATYHAKCFMEIFDHFFGEDLRIRLFSDNSQNSDDVFCQQYYNRNDQKMLFESKRLKHTGADKGLFLDLKFEEFQTQFGIGERKDATLVDDNDKNAKGTIEHGFSAIHHPSSEFKRHGVRFETGKDEVFKEMYQRVVDAQTRFRRETTSELERPFELK